MGEKMADHETDCSLLSNSEV